MKKFLLLLLPLVSSCAENPVPDAKLDTGYLVQSRNAASNSLVTLRRSVNPLTFRQMGFDSVGEAAAATNGEPLLIYEVPLNRLREYKSDPDYTKLVEPTPRVIYPVLVGGRTKSSHTLRLDGVGWRPASRGEPQLIKALVEARDKVNPQQSKTGERPFAVIVPVASLWLLGYHNKAGQVILMTTVEFKSEKVYIPKHTNFTPEAMTILSKLAQRYTGKSN